MAGDNKGSRQTPTIVAVAILAVLLADLALALLIVKKLLFPFSKTFGAYLLWWGTPSRCPWNHRNTGACGMDVHWAEWTLCTPRTSFVGTMPRRRPPHKRDDSPLVRKCTAPNVSRNLLSLDSTQCRCHRYPRKPIVCHDICPRHVSEIQETPFAGNGSSPRCHVH